MDPTVRRRWTADCHADLAGRYGTTVDALEPLDGFESFVFEDHGADRVIRVGHSGRRPLALVEGEVEWLSHLAAHNVAVAEARRSLAGALVERFDDGAGGEFLAVAFRRAAGEQLAVSEWTPEFAHHYGAVLGRMHRVGRDFEPRYRRPAWNDGPMLDVRRHIPANQPRVREGWDGIYARVAGYDCPPDERGLIHQDAHDGNFFVDAGRMTLFDFDDCCYAPFAMELGLVIFYAVVLLDEPDAFAAWFVPNLVAGYRIRVRAHAEGVVPCRLHGNAGDRYVRDRPSRRAARLWSSLDERLHAGASGADRVGGAVDRGAAGGE